MIRKHTLEDSIILAVIILLLLSSCGTRKTETIKRDSISINNTYSQGEKIVLANNYTFRPIDSLKPFKINGQEYDNVAITVNKDVTVTKWKDRNITKTIVTEKTKQTEKSDYSLMWIGIAFVVVTGVIAYLKIPSLRL